MTATAWSILPPIITIVLALWTKEVYMSLIIGIFSGAMLFAGGNFLQATLTMFQVMADKVGSNVNILVFLVILGILVAIVTTVMAVPIDVILFGGFMGDGNSLLAAGLMTMGLSIPVAVAVSSFTFGLVDKTLSVLVCYFIIKSMPLNFLAKLPMSDYILPSKK